MTLPQTVEEFTAGDNRKNFTFKALPLDIPPLGKEGDNPEDTKEAEATKKPEVKASAKAANKARS